MNGNTPNANEIVKALRHIANDKSMLKPFGAGITSKATLVLDAADLIESQAAKIAELNDFQNSQCAKLLEKLDEAERRERAAVEDLKAVLVEGGYGCDYCKHERIQLDCAPSCSSETKLGGWQWRGPQEAGGQKGEDDGTAKV